MADKKRVLVRTVIEGKTDVENRLQAAILMIHHMKEQLDKVENELRLNTYDLNDAKRELNDVGIYDCSLCKHYYGEEEFIKCDHCDFRACEDCFKHEFEHNGIEKLFYRCNYDQSSGRFCYKCASDSLIYNGMCKVCWDCQREEKGHVERVIDEVDREIDEEERERVEMDEFIDEILERIEFDKHNALLK